MEVKGNITGLYFLLRLWNSPDVLPKTHKPDARLVVYEVAEELWPILPRVMPKNAELVIVMDYNPTRVLRRRNVLATVPAKEVPTTMILTLHDDSVGTLPQLTTGALHELMGDLRRAGIGGFGTRQWLISDHDASTAYLAKAAWDASTMPTAVYSSQVRALCGEAAVQPMLKVFHDIEAVTTRLEDHAMGLTFPTARMMMGQWVAEAMPQKLADDQAIYRRALKESAWCRCRRVRRGRLTALLEGTPGVRRAVLRCDRRGQEGRYCGAGRAKCPAKGDASAYREKLAEAQERPRAPLLRLLCDRYVCECCEEPSGCGRRGHDGGVCLPPAETQDRGTSCRSSKNQVIATERTVPPGRKS